ncbi:uncharacterized protein LOC101847093 [Aplysia californica]|uniref:Uncharacterized protein LOC101847093 n=1 Tax=Aplysia californica TaxID=6500 RepID=A0ABM0JJ05_APLCA|nr:uncharacterized protein LOC101847093 [Aplysia californica]
MSGLWKYFILGALVLTVAMGQDAAANETSSAADSDTPADDSSVVAEALSPDTNNTASVDGNGAGGQDPPASTELKEVECKLDEDLTGEWMSTVWGDVSFTDQSLVAEIDPVEGKSNEFECHKKFENGDIIFRSTVFVQDEVEFVYYTCVNFQKRNENNFFARVKTPRNPKVNQLPMEKRPITKTNNTHIRYCKTSPVEGFLLKKGKVQDGALGCPDTIKGIFNVTYKGVTQRKCPDGALLTTCEAPKALSVVHSDCGDNSTTYPESDDFICIGGGLYEVTLFRNSTELNPFTPFSCMTLSVDENDNATVEVTQKGDGCGEKWVKPEGNVHAEEFTLVKTDDCLPDEVIPPEVVDIFEPNSTRTDDTPSDSNETSSGNETSGGQGSGTEPGGDPDDAGSFLVSNGFVVTFLVASLAILLSQHNDLA